MKLPIIGFACFFLSLLQIQAQNVVATIKDYQVEFIILSKNKAIQRVKKSITVHNSEGDMLATPVVFYDRFIKIKKIDATITNAAGKETKFKTTDIRDQSITSGGTIFDDNRIKYFEINPTAYPYTVSYEYEVEFNGLFHYPSFSPIPDFRVDLVKSSFSVKVPKDLDLRYKANFPDSLPIYTEAQGTIHYFWKMDSLEAIRDEVLSPGAEEILPIIYLAANEFEYDGYSGNMQSWNAFGKWLYSLLQTRSTLNPEQIIEIKSISNVHESIPDKVRALYEYMQSKTRYVSIQLGIGGYQPMSAQSVADLGYGDCKALSNYMRVILSAVDIPSNYTVIGAGRSHRSFSFRDFPNTFQANHVILTVPMEEDTLFLECTSQKNPCGYLGSFTGNRPALLVSEDGGRLIKTPSFNLNDYLQQTIGTCQLNSNGTLQGNYCRTYTGLRSEAVAGNDLLSKEDQRAGYLKKINIPSIKLEEIEYDYQKDRHPAMNEKISFNVPGYAQISGTRVFFTPNLFNQWHYQLPANEDRQHPMMIDEAIYDIDTFTIQLPEDYSIEAMPSEVSLETPFGRYHSRVHFENNKLVYFRLLQLSENTYPKEMYADLRSFFKTIQKTDRAQVVLIEKKT